MAQQNKATLKGYFNTGDKPDEPEFTDLIDSYHNITDDGAVQVQPTEGPFVDGDKTKLSNVATGATANETDAQLRDRATHTGTQDAASITGLSAVATSGGYGDLAGVPSEFTPAAHNQAWGTITSTPTTVAGYGITDAASDETVETATVNAQTGTAYTLALTDRGQVVTMDNASANTVTVPDNATEAFDAGSVVNVLQIGAGATTITGDSGVTINGTSGGSVTIQSQYQGVSLLHIATDVWIASGSI